MKKKFIFAVISVFTALYCLISLSACSAGEASVTQGLSFSLIDGGSSYAVSGQGIRNATEIEIPSTHNNKPVTAIDNMAFSNLKDLTDITIPDGIAFIGDNAFLNCEELSGIALPDSVTAISYNAFTRCSKLSNVTFGNGLKSIGKEAFLGCSSINKITLPDNMTTIGKDAFLGCTSLSQIYYNGDITSWCAINGLDNVMGMANNDSYNPNKVPTYRKLYFNKTEPGGEFAIPDSVTEIKSCAFMGCTNLTSLVVPESVAKIGNGAFSGCRALRKLTIMNGATSLGNSAFYACPVLMNCTIPDSITSIGNGAFQYCPNLKNIEFNGTCAQWTAIDKKTGWNYDTGNFTVTCTDGKLDKNDKEITEY